MITSWGCSPRVSSSSFLQRSPSRNVHLLLKQKAPIYIHYSLHCGNCTKKFLDQNIGNPELMYGYPLNCDADLISVEREKRSRSAFKSSRTSRGREREKKFIHFRGPEEKRKKAASTQTSTASMSSRRTERTRYCDWEPAVSLHFQIRRTRRICAPSLATIPFLRSRETVFPGDQDRARPPSRVLHIHAMCVPGRAWNY